MSADHNLVFSDKIFFAVYLHGLIFQTYQRNLKVEISANKADWKIKINVSDPKFQEMYPLSSHE